VERDLRGKRIRMSVSMLQCGQSEFAAVKKTSRSVTGEQQTRTVPRA
jgi:hypothetical protein